MIADIDDAVFEGIRADLQVMADLTRHGMVKQPPRTEYEEINFHRYMLEMAHRRVSEHNPALAKIQPLGDPIGEEITRHRAAMLHIRLWNKQAGYDFLPDPHYGEQKPLRN
jgi:hypothetical protein